MYFLILQSVSWCRLWWLTSPRVCNLEQSRHTTTNPALLHSRFQNHNRVWRPGVKQLLSFSSSNALVCHQQMRERPSAASLAHYFSSSLTRPTHRPQGHNAETVWNSIRNILLRTDAHFLQTKRCPRMINPHHMPRLYNRTTIWSTSKMEMTEMKKLFIIISPLCYSPEHTALIYISVDWQLNIRHSNITSVPH